MSDTPNENKKDMDQEISLAMDKIIEDTIGHIEVVAPTQSGKTKKKKSVKVNRTTQLPTKKQVIVTNQEMADRKVEEAVPPKKDVQLFFPTQKNTVQHIQPAKETKKAKQAQAVSYVPAEEPVKKKHILRTVLLTLMSLVLLGALGTYGYYAYYYHDKFMPGTFINQIDCHEMSVAQAEEQIRRRVEDYNIEIDFRDDKKATIDGEAIGYAFVSDGSVAQILEDQNPIKWIMGHFENYEHEVPESITFDDEKLKAQYNTLESTQASNQVKPEDAYVHYQNKNFEIIPEIEGTTIDDEVLYQAIAAAIRASERTCSAEVAAAYVEPQLRADNAELIAEEQELNTLVDASIVYKLPQGDEVLDGNMLRTWLMKDSNGRYVKDEEVFKEHIKAYVEALAEETDTLGKDRKFKMTGGKEVMVGGGDYGWKINQKEEIAMLTKNIDEKDKLEREPEYSSRELTTENNGFGGSYIEVNLSAQHLYVYEEGRLVLDSKFVSGRMTRKRYTPPGIFTLSFKQKHKVLRGPVQPDGSYEWESPVTYWMPFNKGIGFHDATWRGSYGGTIYNYSGSHGCINMPYKKAQALYEIINKEMPIICFYPDEYTVRR